MRNADIELIFNAGRVRRWHNNPVMSRTDDYNDAHQGRVARLLLALHPNPTLMLLVAALTHDDGELFAGDMTRPVKDGNPELREAVREIEDAGTCEIWGIEKPIELSPIDQEWLKFADRLDSYMWMLHTNPELSRRSDRICARQDLEQFARKHDIWYDICRVISYP